MDCPGSCCAQPKSIITPRWVTSSSLVPPRPPPAPGSALRPLCNRGLNVPSTLIETAVRPGAGEGRREGVGVAVGLGESASSRELLMF